MATRDQRPTQDTVPFLGASAPSRLDGLAVDALAREREASAAVDVTTHSTPDRRTGTAPQSEAAGDPPAWTPQDDTSVRECQKCGAHLSATWRRVWGDDGVVEYCRNCVPRSVRFGSDVYGREPGDFDPGEFDVGAHNP